MAEMRNLGGGVVTDQQPSELALRVIGRLKELRCNKAELALQIGCSRSMVSQYLAGKYKSDPTTIETALEGWLQEVGEPEEGQMEEEEAELQEAEESIPEKVTYFASSDYLNVMAVCQSCQENMGLGIVVGKSGYGKTHALKKYAKLPRVAYLECDDTMGSRDLVEEIEGCLGMAKASGGTIHKRVSRIREFLNVNSGYLLIIDEADNPDSLQQKGTESMQALADGITAGTPAAQAEAQNAGQSILDNFNLDTTGAGSAGANLMQSVTDGINTGTPEAQAAAQNAGQEIMSSFNIDTSGAGTAGTSLIESVTSGITANAGNAQAAAQSAGQEIMSAFNIDTSGAGSTGANLMQSVTDGIASGTAGAEAAAQSAGQEIMSAFNIDASGAGSTGANLMQSVTDGITSGTAGAEAAAQSAGQGIMSSFSIDTSGAGSAGANLIESLTSGITANAGSAQSAAQSAGQSALDAVDNLNATTVGTNMIKDIGSGITSGSGTTTSAAQKAGTDAMNAFRNAVSSASGLGRQMMSNVASGISSAGSSAVSTASSIAYQIKAAFENIRITVPRPSLPHVNVSYSTVGNGKATASVPNFSVSYYAKGAIMKKPTMFGMNGTSPMIGGEAGEEAIVPLDSLWNRMRNVVMNTFTMFFPGGKKQSDPAKEKNTVTQTKEKTEKQQTTTTKPETKQTQPQGGTKYQTYHVTMNIDAQSIDDLRKLKKLLSELDGDNDPVTA